MTSYALALVCGLAGIALRLALDPLLGPRVPFITSFPAVAAAAWLGGPGPGLVATGFSAAAVMYLWLPPQVSVVVAHGGDLLSVAIFLCAGAAISGLSGALRRQRRLVGDLAEGLSRAEEAEVRLAAIVQSSDDAIIGKDLRGAITSWNPAAERMFGFTSAEAVGRPVTLIIPPERQAEEDEVLARIQRGENVENFRTVRVRKDGQRLDISLTVSPIRNRRGEIVGASKIARDVSDRVRGEAWVNLLARAGEVLTSSLDWETTLKQVARLAVPDMASGCVVDLLDAEGVPQRAAVAHADPEAESLIWALPRRVVRPPDHPLMRVATTGEPILCEQVTEAQRQALAPDPAYAARVLAPAYFESFIVVPLRLRDVALGTMTFGIGGGRRYDPRDLGFVQDLARRAAQALDNARLYREAEAANRRKDEFLAVLSHELRTPLNSVLGWAHLLRDGRVEPTAVPRALDIIVRNAEAQVRLVEDLLDVSRIVTGKMRLDVRPVKPIAVVEAAIESLRPAAEARGIRLQPVLDPRAGPVAGDPERLQQVIWNLVSNALKFTPKGGRVQVRLERVNSHVEIVVSDTGKGIPAHVLPHVFEHFQQGDSSSTRAHGGLGLGLALVKYLVELHGGTVRAASPGEGQGATFTVELPLLVHPELATAERLHPTADAPATVASPAPAGLLKGVHVLAVDDEPDALELIGRLLGLEGAEVRVSSSVPEALETLAAGWPHVLVADIEMPGQDGYQLIEKVRALDGGRLPAVAVTAYGRPADRIRALSAGFSMHVAKPFDPAELVAVVTSLAQRARARA